LRRNITFIFILLQQPVVNMATDAGCEALRKRLSVEQAGEELQQIEEEITCAMLSAICQNLYDDPKTIIPCLHTFCKSCLEASIKSNLKMSVTPSCPVCRALLPREEISSIPTNFTIKRLIEILQKKKKNEAWARNVTTATYISAIA